MNFKAKAGDIFFIEPGKYKFKGPSEIYFGGFSKE